jgi:hypothetical protein
MNGNGRTGTKKDSTRWASASQPHEMNGMKMMCEAHRLVPDMGTAVLRVDPDASGCLADPVC